jgi:hypothetical protein
MYIATAFCNGKCCKEAGIPLSVCLNDAWRGTATIAMVDEGIIERYLSNSITTTICFAGLEPFEQFDQVYNFIEKLRKDYNCDDTVLIYTGYNKEEIAEQIEKLKDFDNIIIKFGRFVPDNPGKFDDVLGVRLASDNQYAERIS